MIRRLVARSEAEADITEAALWYEERVSGLGLEFVGEVGLAIRRATETPQIFSPCTVAGSEAGFDYAVSLAGVLHRSR